MPKVSVVIPTHNRADVVGDAIQSVIFQTFEDWELIVVDDASEDNTEEVIGSFKDQRIRYVRHEANRGGAAARNTGVRESSGDYIAFLDSDDRWMKKKLEGQVAVFRNNDEETGLVYTGLTREGEKTGQKCPKHEGWISEKLFLNNPVGSCSVAVVKKNVISEVGGFDEELPSSQDKDLWLRISHRYKIRFLSGIYVIKRETKNKKQISRNHVSKCEGKVKFYNKHMHKFSDRKKSMYLRKMGRIFRTRMTGKQYVAKICYIKSIEYKHNNLRSLVFLALLLVSREKDLYISKKVRKIAKKLGLSYDLDAYDM
jgi:glycosyltransferase involved in cell wall biosynthesis